MDGGRPRWQGKNGRDDHDFTMCICILRMKDQEAGFKNSWEVDDVDIDMDCPL